MLHKESANSSIHNEMPATTMNALLVCLLSNVKFFRQSIDLIDSVNLFSAEPIQHTIWRMCKDLVEKTGSIPSMLILRIEFPDYMRENNAAEVDISTGLLMLECMLKHPTESLSISWAEQKLLEYRDYIIQKELGDFLKNSRDLDDCDEELNKAQQILKQNPFSSVEAECPFDDLDYYTSTVGKSRLGISFIDSILGGGLQPGEIMGLLAPSGGGKTTFAMQMAFEKINLRQHVLYMSTEQQLRGDMTTRLFVLATGLDRDNFRKPFGELDPNIQKTLLNKKDTWQKYYHFLDCSGARSDMDGNVVKHDISNTEQLLKPAYEFKKNTGEDIGLIIVDWWGSAKNQMIRANSEKLFNETAIRRASQAWLQKLSVLAQDLKTCIVVFHQLSGEAAERSSKHKPSSHAAQEDKNFNNYFDFCLTVGQRDSDDIAWMKADKARTSASLEVQIKLLGNMCKWIHAKDPDFVADGDIIEDPPIENLPAPAPDKPKEDTTDDLRYLDPEA